MRVVHPIEQRSYEILRSRVDLSALPPYTRAVTERVVHASADLDYVDDLVCDEAALADAARRLAAGVPVVADVEMVAAGITGRPVVCRVKQARASAGRTRSAEAVHVALDEVGPGAIWVIGCAPTALEELIELAAKAEPALVIGLPVGFVGAAESKEALIARAARGCITEHPTPTSAKPPKEISPSPDERAGTVERQAWRTAHVRSLSNSPPRSYATVARDRVKADVAAERGCVARDVNPWCRRRERCLLRDVPHRHPETHCHPRGMMRPGAGQRW